MFVTSQTYGRVFRRHTVVAVVMALLWAVGEVWAGASPSAQQILKKMEETFKKAKSYEMTVSTTMKVSMSGGAPAAAPGANNMNMQMSVHVAMVKPNKMLFEPKDEQSRRMMPKMVSNGKTMWVFNPMLNQYMEKPAPEDLSKMPMMGGGNFMPINPNQDISKHVKSAKVVGSGKVGKVDAYIIEAALTAPAMPGMAPGGSQGTPLKVKFWVGKKDYLLYKFEGGMTNTLSAPPPGGQGKPQSMTMKMSFSGTISGVKVNKPLPGSLFTFKPPAGAKKVEQFGPPGGAPSPR